MKLFPGRWSPTSPLPATPLSRCSTLAVVPSYPNTRRAQGRETLHNGQLMWREREAEFMLLLTATAVLLRLHQSRFDQTVPQRSDFRLGRRRADRLKGCQRTANGLHHPLVGLALHLTGTSHHAG